MFSYTSTNPVTVTRDGVSQVYDTWKLLPTAIPRLQINPVSGIMTLEVSFSLWGIGPDSKPIELGGSKATLEVDNVAADSVLSAPIAAFFSAVAAKAVGTGVIS